MADGAAGASSSSSASSSDAPLTAEDHLEVLECARYGEVDDLKYLLSIGCEVNYRDAGGSTALHKAAANGFLDVADVLLAAGALHVANDSGNFPLHYACLNGKSDMVAWILAKYDDADIYVKNTFGRSAFTEALSAGHESIARLMLAHKSADPGRGKGGPAKGPGSNAAAGGAEGSGAAAAAAGAGEDVEEDEGDIGEDDADLVDEEAARKEKEKEDEEGEGEGEGGENAAAASAEGGKGGGGAAEAAAGGGGKQ